MTKELERTVPKDESELAEILENMTAEDRAQALAMLTGMQVGKVLAEQNKTA